MNHLQSIRVMKDISRRSFLKYMGLGSAAALAACAGKR
ncbi:MAG: twin-arginine translocation signal domain-containing protein, partial [Prevotella sp.]|nr:twin-arginine translocation signal domain-containing protein [Prevotella sp.]